MTTSLPKRTRSATFSRGNPTTQGGALRAAVVDLGRGSERRRDCRCRHLVLPQVRTRTVRQDEEVLRIPNPLYKPIQGDLQGINDDVKGIRDGLHPGSP